MEYSKLIEKIREKRILLGYTQKSFANEVGLSAAFYSRVELNKARASMDTLIRCCTKLGLPVEWAVGKTQQNYATQIALLISKYSPERQAQLYHLLEEMTRLLEESCKGEKRLAIKKSEEYSDNMIEK